MLIRLTLENWMSFRDPVEFSMIAGRERQHSGRVPRLGKYRLGVLPLAAIFGGNASGKSNFCAALAFAKKLVTKGTSIDQSIPVRPFSLGAPGNETPTRFAFEILVNETIYAYSFAVTARAVLEEKLLEIAPACEKLLYERKGDKINLDSAPKKDRQFLDFAFRGTRDNQLFLTNAVSQKVETFKPVYDWFMDTLALISPDEQLNKPYFITKGALRLNELSSAISRLDAGIADLDVESMPLENAPFPENFKRKLMELGESGKANHFDVRGDNNGDIFDVFKKEGKWVADKLVTRHRKEDGTTIPFELKHESDGTRRALDLLPAFLNMKKSDSRHVYVIDELDRSLHTLLTREMLLTYLEACSAETRSQLLFTTHDVMLMDQKLARRDEMWVTERDGTGNTTLIPFSEYKDVRYDKDIRKSYLLGRMGGVPKILSTPRVIGDEENDR